MYLRYIYKLHDLHHQAENFLEAGFTLKLYADQLSWGTRTLPKDHHFPDQQEWERKEQLYDEIIRYFDRGKVSICLKSCLPLFYRHTQKKSNIFLLFFQAWEKGIPLCKELATLYETKLFDYQKLSQILKAQAKFFDNILTQLRPEPEYFRVGFYGLSFPLFVRVSVAMFKEEV